MHLSVYKYSVGIAWDGFGLDDLRHSVFQFITIKMNKLFWDGNLLWTMFVSHWIFFFIYTNDGKN